MQVHKLIYHTYSIRLRSYDQGILTKTVHKTLSGGGGMGGGPGVEVWAGYMGPGMVGVGVVAWESSGCMGPGIVGVGWWPGGLVGGGGSRRW